jgi:tRNA pseudouridine65 synthase
MLEILFQDECLVAINKPAGVLVHRSQIDPGAEKVALQMVRDQIGRRVYPVHRLDKPTSGVLLFALTPESAQVMTTRFTGRGVSKIYLAVVRGHVEETATIDYALKEVLDKKTDRKARTFKPPQEAVTSYRRIAQVELPYPVGRYETCRYSLVEVAPTTGRKHQIRRHMKHIFHPILGDRKYGDWRHNRFLEAQFGSRRLLLHAATLAFDHPHTEQSLRIVAPLDASFRALLAALRLSNDDV